MVSDIFHNVTAKLHRYKAQHFDKPEFLIVDEDTFYDLQEDKGYRDLGPDGKKFGNLTVCVVLGVRHKTIIEVM